MMWSQGISKAKGLSLESCFRAFSCVPQLEAIPRSLQIGWMTLRASEVLGGPVGGLLLLAQGLWSLHDTRQMGGAEEEFV